MNWREAQEAITQHDSAQLLLHDGDGALYHLLLPAFYTQ